MNKKTTFTTKFRSSRWHAWTLVGLVLLIGLAAWMLTPQDTGLASTLTSTQPASVQIGTSPTPTSLLEPTLIPMPDEPAEEPRLPLGVSSLIGATLLALAYWLNKRGRAKEHQK